MLKKASARATAAAMGCGGDPQPQPPSRPTPKLTADGGTGTGTGRPAGSRLLSTRSFPSLFTDSSSVVPELARNAPCSSGVRNSRSGGSIGGGRPAAGLAGVLVAEDDKEGAAERCGSGNNRGRVLLGMRRLRVQLPPPPPTTTTGRVPGGGGGGGGELPGSPIEFGVKNRDAQLALLSPVQRSPLSSAAARMMLARRRTSEVEPGEELAVAVDEDEEDYTCVIARGPNPKMTHIFEDRVVESRAGDGGGGGCGDAIACCFVSSSCTGCNNKDAALLLPRGEGEFCSKQWNGEVDSSVKLKP